MRKYAHAKHPKVKVHCIRSTDETWLRFSQLAADLGLKQYAAFQHMVSISEPIMRATLKFVEETIEDKL